MSRDYQRELRRSRTPFSSSFFNYVVFFTILLAFVWSINAFFRLHDEVVVDDGISELRRVEGFRSWESLQGADLMVWLGTGDNVGKGVGKVAAFLLITDPGTAGADARLCGAHYDPTRFMLRYDIKCYSSSLWKDDLYTGLYVLYKDLGSDKEMAYYFEDQYTSFRRAMTLHLGEARKAGRF